MIDPGQRTLLRAGRFRLAFTEGRLQWLSVGEVEVVRRIYVALRTETWSTVPFTIERFDADVAGDAFSLRYDATASSSSGSLAFTVEISGSGDSRLDMVLRGEAQTVLATNRVGLCLHYPHELAGSELRAWRADDPAERDARFPSLVEPVPPLKHLGGILHPVDASTWCRASFHGDLFEMEDQRNFGDASFKVYSTPSDDPVPRVLQPGDRVEQRVVVELVDAQGSIPTAVAARRPPRFLGAATLTRSTSDPWRKFGAPPNGADHDPVTLEISDEVAGVVPELGTDITSLCTSSAHAGSSGAAVGAAARRLTALNVSNVRLELDLGDPAWADTCRLGSELASTAGVGLDLVVAVDGGAWPASLSVWLAEHAPHVATICIIGTLTDPVLTAGHAHGLRQVLRSAGHEIPIGAGTLGWFIDVNVAKPPVDELDFLAYAVTPQVHVFDDDALRENLHGIEPALATARTLARGRPVRVGPVTLRPRGEEAGATDTLWPTPRDPRLDHPFGAVWTLGAIARHAAGGAAALALFELEGSEAIAGSTRGDIRSEDPTVAGVIRDLAPLAGCEVFKVGSSAPLDAFGCAVRTDRGGVCWLANPTDRVVEVELRWPASLARATDMIDLRPYEIRRVPWRVGG